MGSGYYLLMFVQILRYLTKFSSKTGWFRQLESTIIRVYVTYWYVYALDVFMSASLFYNTCGSIFGKLLSIFFFFFFWSSVAHAWKQMSNSKSGSRCTGTISVLRRWLMHRPFFFYPGILCWVRFVFAQARKWYFSPSTGVINFVWKSTLLKSNGEDFFLSMTEWKTFWAQIWKNIF